MDSDIIDLGSEHDFEVEEDGGLFPEIPVVDLDVDIQPTGVQAATVTSNARSKKKVIESEARDHFDKLKSVIDPQRHYKKGDSKSKTLPKNFQVGTGIESVSDFFPCQLAKKERRASLADELLSDQTLGQYRSVKSKPIVNRRISTKFQKIVWVEQADKKTGMDSDIIDLGSEHDFEVEEDGGPFPEIPVVDLDVDIQPTGVQAAAVTSNARSKKKVIESEARDHFDKLSSVIDPERHYKKGDSKSKSLPKYFQKGTGVESASDFYPCRLTKNERKASLADELLSYQTYGQYRSVKSKPRRISTKLQKIVGVEQADKKTALEKVWEYIKREELLDAKKMLVNSDDLLRDILGMDSIYALRLNKELIKKHMVPIAPYIDSDEEEAEMIKQWEKENEENHRRARIPVPISDDLAEFLGAPDKTMVECETQKKVWSYITSNNCLDSQHPTVHCDEKLEKLFKKTSFNAYQLPTLIIPHLLKRALQD